MATVNQYVPIGLAAPVTEIEEFRRQFPHIYEALNTGLATQINQLNIRVGGSGGGGSVANLDEISARIEENSSQIAAALALSKSDSGVDEAISDIVGRIGRKVTQEQHDNGDLLTMIARVSAIQGRIIQRIEELEALCLSSLARL